MRSRFSDTENKKQKKSPQKKEKEISVADAKKSQNHTNNAFFTKILGSLNKKHNLCVIKYRFRRVGKAKFCEHLFDTQIIERQSNPTLKNLNLVTAREGQNNETEFY